MTEPVQELFVRLDPVPPHGVEVFDPSELPGKIVQTPLRGDQHTGNA